MQGTGAEQYWGGLAGAFDVADKINKLSGLETHILFLKDIRLSGSEPELETELEPYTSMLGTYEVWEIINQSVMDHPFHQHVNPCQGGHK